MQCAIQEQIEESPAIFHFRFRFRELCAIWQIGLLRNATLQVVVVEVVNSFQLHLLLLLLGLLQNNPISLHCCPSGTASW